MNHVGSNDGHVNECTLTALERERVALFTISSGKEEDDFHSSRFISLNIVSVHFYSEISIEIGNE